MYPIKIDQDERYQTIMNAANKYHVSRRIIMNAAIEAGALIKITDRTLRIDMDVLEAHIKKKSSAN